MNSLKNISRLVPLEIWEVIMSHLSIKDYYHLCLVYYINESIFKFLIKWAKEYYPCYIVMKFHIILYDYYDKGLLSQPCIIPIPLKGLSKLIKIDCKYICCDKKIHYYHPHIIMRKNGFPQITQISARLDNSIYDKGFHYLESFSFLNYHQKAIGFTGLYGNQKINFSKGYPMIVQFWKNGILLFEQPYDINKIYNINHNIGLFEIDNDVRINIPIEEIYGKHFLQKFRRRYKLKMLLLFLLTGLILFIPFIPIIVLSTLF